MANPKRAIILVEPENAKYQDSEFSDIEIEAFMAYFKVQTYDRLKSLLRAMKNAR
jgi:hypothetical protein